VGDVLDPPARGAEREDLAHARLVDHLLVQLADPRVPLAHQVHAKQPAIGDGAAGGHRQPLRPGPGAEAAVHAVPDQARPQLRELVGRVASREHVEHALERAAGQLGERRGPARDLLQPVHRPVVHGHHGDGLLREHVERIAGVAHRLDRALAHALDHDRGLDQVAAELGEDHTAADGPDLVPGPPDALEALRH
jgi:hypothetical protein